MNFIRRARSLVNLLVEQIAGKGSIRMQWFDVDKAGLAKLLARKGKEFVLFELVQNAWDEDTRQKVILRS